VRRVAVGGADAFRFTMVAFAAQGRDVLWSPKRVEANHRFQTKIWQALRYTFMHAEGYDPNGPMEYGPYERWIRVRAGQAVARVRLALDEYKFNEVASEVQAFVWNEFCDWYLELSKTTVYDESKSPAAKNAVKHTLFEMMGVIVRLLHPVMPFLTEEIWSKLPGSQGFVAVAAYPKVSDFPTDDGVLDEIAVLQETITEVRRIRGEMEIAMKKSLELHVGDDGLRRALSGHARALMDMARVEVRELVVIPDPAATAVVRGAQLSIPLEGVVDVQEELDRLGKVLVKVEEDVMQLQKRLSNRSFVDRAPPEVVAEVQGKLDAAVVRRDTLLASRDRLLRSAP
jgi:valyl-tRNA synthetase